VAQNVAPNHRANDVIVLEGRPQALIGRFMYGPIDVVSLTGEKVTCHFTVCLISYAGRVISFIHVYVCADYVCPQHHWSAIFQVLLSTDEYCTDSVASPSSGRLIIRWASGTLTYPVLTIQGRYYP